MTMKKLMHILFLSCLKATELIEKKLHFKLSFTDKMQLKTHKMMCKACANYEKQSVLLEKGISNSHKIEFTEEDLTQLKMIINQKLEGFK
jgi:hypothetical protein